MGIRTGSWGIEREKEEVFDGHTSSDILGRVLRFWAVCGCQDLGPVSATGTLKTGRAKFALVAGGV